MLYFTGTDVAALSALSALARMLLDDTTQAAMQSTLGLGSAATQPYQANTFTVTATGFSGTAPSGTARYVKVGALVSIVFPRLEGTSNATTFTLTGLPVALQAVSMIVTQLVGVRDNGAFLFAPGFLVLVPGSSVLTLYKDVPGTAWTASGTKTMVESVLTYAAL
jgi:hypothetical protein